jgi:hypothetical protein
LLLVPAALLLPHLVRNAIVGCVHKDLVRHASTPLAPQR